MVANIVDVAGVTYVDLMRLSHEGVIPHLDEGVIAHRKEQMRFELEGNSVETSSVHGLHLDFNGHFKGIVSANRGVLEDDPQSISLKF
jgi:hypothetical protein